MSQNNGRASLAADYGPDKEAPFAPEAEEALLGSLLIDSDIYFDLADLVKPGDFFIHRHRWIWEAIAALKEAVRPCDVLTITDELIRAGRLEEVGGTAYIARLLTSVPSSLHALDYAGIIKRCATRRKLMEAANAIAALASDNERDVDALISDAEARVYEVQEHGAKRGDIASQQEAVQEWYRDISAYAQDGKLPGLTTGWRRLDTVTLGYPRGKFGIIAGRPSMGKTSFMSQSGVNQARVKLNIGVVSLEVKKKAWVEAAALAELGLDRRKLKPEDMALVIDKCDEIQNLPIAYYDKGQSTAIEVERAIRAMARKLGRLDIVYIDHMGYIEHDIRKSGGSLTHAIGQTSKRLARVAKELDCAVIGGCQLTRASAREGDEPTLVDLRDSGTLEEDARWVIFIHRPTYYTADEHDAAKATLPHDAYLLIRKNDEGPTGKVTMAFVKAWRRFAEIRNENA